MTNRVASAIGQLSPDELLQVQQGKLCPCCKKKNVKCVGSAPDGFYMNYAYDCLDCGAQWEG